MAGDRGVAEVLRRAEALVARKKGAAVTLGLIRSAWSDFPASGEAPSSAASIWRGIEAETAERQRKAAEAAANRATPEEIRAALERMP